MGFCGLSGNMNDDDTVASIPNGSQICRTHQKAARRCYLIFKSFQSRILIRAFKTCQAIVGSQFAGLVTSFAQRQATAWSCSAPIGGLHTFPYTERLTLLGLERLEVRRIRANLLFVYKLLFGFTALRAEDYFNLSVFTATRGHPYKLFLTRCFTDVRKYVSLTALLKYGTSCLSDTDFTCINSFKRRLTRINLSIYCDHD